MNTIVVTRHPALVSLLKERGILTGDCSVLEHVTPDDVRGRRVVGILPFHLACLAESVVVLDLALTPEDRKAGELPIERLREIAGKAEIYCVRKVTPV